MVEDAVGFFEFFFCSVLFFHFRLPVVDFFLWGLSSPESFIYRKETQIIFLKQDFYDNLA